MQNTLLDMDDIIDAYIQGSNIHLLLRDGRHLVLPYTPSTRELYWRIKIRNRRRAFGLL